MSQWGSSSKPGPWDWRGMTRQARAQGWGLGSRKDHDGWGGFPTSGARERKGPQASYPGRADRGGTWVLASLRWGLTSARQMLRIGVSLLTSSILLAVGPVSLAVLVFQLCQKFPVITWFKPSGQTGHLIGRQKTVHQDTQKGHEWGWVVLIFFSYLYALQWYFIIVVKMEEKKSTFLTWHNDKSLILFYLPDLCLGQVTYTSELQLACL